MLTPPESLGSELITGALATDWNLSTTSLTYAPLGFGSHHWIAETPVGDPWFVTVDDLRSAYLGANEDAAFAVVNTAFQAAMALRDKGNLDFVIAPVADRSGKSAHRLDERHSMAVFPFLDVEATKFDKFPLASDRYDALGLVGEIHNASGKLSIEHLRAETFLVPNRGEFLQALSALDIPWESGPYAESAWLLLREHTSALHQRLDQFDRLATDILADRSGWVITHGEPHAGNVIRTRSGSLVVVDWGAVAYAPRERDVWMLLDQADPDWSAYTATTQVTSLSERTLLAYRLFWNLSDIAVFVSWFRSPHDRTDEMAIAWAELESYVASVAFSLCNAG